VEAIDAGSDVLLLGTPRSETDDRACADHLDPATSGNIVIVTFVQTPDARIGVLRRLSPDLRASVSAIDVGGRSRSAAETSGGGPSGTPVAQVADPGDLQRLGLTISDHLAGLDTDERTTLCFHSLSALLQYVDLRRGYRFLHTLIGRLDSVEASSHYHLDPEAHDEQTVATLRPLFDAVVDVGDE
jgi:hypothetical protein